MHEAMLDTLMGGNILKIHVPNMPTEMEMVDNDDGAGAVSSHGGRHCDGKPKISEQLAETLNVLSRITSSNGL
jgi:hypothetical protein